MSAISFELTLWVLPPRLGSMTWQNATARFIGSALSPAPSWMPSLASAFQQPTILAASSTRRLLFSSFSRVWRRRLMWLSSTASTMTL
ncbi:hypothetical protein [Stenotrophomonas maltophilia]|uniref:hypothetical protein n=1 Tax=Stenotrophomonas maltophilia TaxID=40324 RepID=UPI0018EC95FA|nr:hypothetical protein [Stenotrophomonas maltophilia]